MIYFIEARGLVKIGRSNDPKRRLQMLSTGCPFVCTLIGVTEGAEKEEREIHQRFSHLREKGEWFRLTEEVKEFIQEHATRPENEPRSTVVDHALARHLASSGESISAFAERVGVSRVHLYRIMGGNNVRTATIKKICAATKGAISFNDFLRAAR